MRWEKKDHTSYQIQKGNLSPIISLKNPLDYDMGPNQLDPSPHPKQFIFILIKKIKEEEEERTLDAYTTTNYYKYQKLIPYTLPRQYCLWHSSLKLRSKGVMYVMLCYVTRVLKKKERRKQVLLKHPMELRREPVIRAE